MAETRYIYEVWCDRIVRYEVVKETPKMYFVRSTPGAGYARCFRKKGAGEPAFTPQEAILRHKTILANLIEVAKRNLAGYEQKLAEADRLQVAG